MPLLHKPDSCSLASVQYRQHRPSEAIRHANKAVMLFEERQQGAEEQRDEAMSAAAAARRELRRRLRGVAAAQAAANDGMRTQIDALQR